MKIRAAAVLALAALLAVSLDTFAQQGTSELRGVVTDPQQSALPGVTVMIKNEETGNFRQTTTDAQGVYFIGGIAPGRYELTADLSGFAPFRKRGIRLEVGRTATIDARMSLTAMAEEISVTAAAPVVDVTSKEIGGNITSRELTELPSVNRNFIGFVGLLPGVIPSISTESFGSDSVSVNGQDPRNNNYLVDGANNNDDVIGQRAGTQARTPIEAIQEFQVLTGQYDAEFGRTSGGVINAVTRQGTNQIKGTLFGYLQDAQFTHKDFFAEQRNLAKPDTQNLQYGFTLGGPILHDRLHVFTSVERVEIDRGISVVIPTRSDLNYSATTQDRVWNTMVRLDHQINARHTWAVRWLREQSPQSNQIIPTAGLFPTLAAAREENDIDQTAVLHGSSVFGNSKLNTARVSWTQEDVAFANAGFNGNGRQQAPLPPTLAFQSYIDQQANTAQARINDAYAIEDIFSWYTTGHELKFGVNYTRITEALNTQDNLNGTFTFGRSDAPFNAADPRTYPDRLTIRVPGESNLDIALDSYSAFVQDKWKASDRLTVSAGLRYDLERLPLEATDNPLFTDPDDYPLDSNNFAPRLGATYDLGFGRTTILRGGVGRFYDKTHLELIQGVATAGMFSNSFVVAFPATGPDLGPRNGRLPTDPMLVNGPAIDPVLLQQMFPSGTRQKNTGTINLDTPDRVISYTDQLSVGVERELRSNLSASVDYVHAEGRDQLMNLQLNPLTRAGRDTTKNVATRTNPSFPSTSSVLARVNAGETTYDALELQLDHHLGGNYQYRFSYTYSHSRGNTAAAAAPVSDFQVGTDMNLDENEGPTDFDRPHNAVFSGSWRVPHTGGLTLATVARYLAGRPFTIFNSTDDANLNGINTDPLAQGKYSGSGLNSISVFNRGGRNGARGPDFFQMDLRAGYQIPIRGLQVELFGELFNVTNRANFDNPSGDQSSPNFLILRALRDGAIPRTAQLGARVVF